MRILLVNDIVSPIGGAERLILALRKGLISRGHEVGVFGTGVHRIPSLDFGDWHCRGTDTRFQTLLSTANPFAWFGFNRVLKRFKPDVIHLSMFRSQLSPSILQPLQSVPAVYHVVTFEPICLLGTKMRSDGERCEQHAGRPCLNSGCLQHRSWICHSMADTLWRHWKNGMYVVAISRCLAFRLSTEGVPVNQVVAGGVPAQVPSLQLSRKRRIVFAGRLVREKGADVLLRAFGKVRKIFPEIELDIVGNGPELHRLLELCRQSDLQGVHFRGFLEVAAMNELFRSAWVQVMPSVWEETFGLTALDAMMRGTPVIASRIGGFAETIVDGKTGILFPAGDAHALAEAMIHVLRDKKRVTAMGTAGHRHAMAHFTEDRMVEDFISIYEGLKHGRIES